MKLVIIEVKDGVVWNVYGDVEYLIYDNDMVEAGDELNKDILEGDIPGDLPVEICEALGVIFCEMCGGLVMEAYCPHDSPELVEGEDTFAPEE